MKLTKQEVLHIFRSEVLPAIRQRFEQDGTVDADARRQAWNDYTDQLCREGRITMHQYESWSNPF